MVVCSLGALGIRLRRVPRGYSFQWGSLMALDVDTLRSMTTAQLRALRTGYVNNKKSITAAHSSRAVSYQTDTRRCDDAVRMIDAIIRTRTRKYKALGEFR